MTDHRYKTTLARAPFSGDGHTILANAALRDRRLSWKARGILGYLGSHSFGWGVSEKQLADEAPDGLASLRSGLAELEEFGYMRRFRERLANGSLGDALWVVSDSPGTLGGYAAELRASFQAEGRRFVEMPVRTRKRSKKKAAEPTCENHTLDDSQQDRRSDPTCDFPTLGNPNQADRISKKTKDEGEGVEGDARARASDPASTGDEPVWGVTGGASFAAPSLASANLVRDIAGKALLPEETLSVEDHQRLASLVEAARPLVQARKGLSWQEYEAWLRRDWVRPDGRRTFRSLVGALAWRLQPEQIQGAAWAWACERRGAQEASQARGERDVPTPQGGAHTGTCGVHGVDTFEGKCAVCDWENAQEDRRYKQTAAEKTPEDGDGQDHEHTPAQKHFEGQDDATTAELQQMRASFAEAEHRAAQNRERELAGLKAMFEKTRAGAAREETARLSKRK